MSREPRTIAGSIASLFLDVLFDTRCQIATMVGYCDSLSVFFELFVRTCLSYFFPSFALQPLDGFLRFHWHPHHLLTRIVYHNKHVLSIRVMTFF